MKRTRQGLNLVVAIAAAGIFCCAAWAGTQAPAANAQTPAAAAPAQTAASAGQAAAPALPTDLAGIWQGTLPPPPNGQSGTRIVVKVTKAADGSYKATLYNADHPGPPLVFNTATLESAQVKFATPMMSVEGTLSADGKTIDAKFGVGGPNPLAISLARTAPDAAWPLPEPMKRMAADAMPKFDVVTVKPTPPGRPGKNIGFDGSRFRFRGANLDDIIALGYGLHTKQMKEVRRGGNLRCDLRRCRSTTERGNLKSIVAQSLHRPAPGRKVLQVRQ